MNDAYLLIYMSSGKSNGAASSRRLQRLRAWEKAASEHENIIFFSADGYMVGEGSTFLCGRLTSPWEGLLYLKPLLDTADASSSENSCSTDELLL